MSSGSLLYPSLDAATGRRILADRASMSLDELELLGTVTHPDAAPAPTGGHPVDTRRLQAVQKAIREVAAEAGYPQALKRGHEQSFDRPCGSTLFQTMSIVTADAADDGVWTFLTLVLVPEIGPWRFPDRAEDRLLGRPRNVLRRLWWRAWALGPHLDLAPRDCTPLGEDEFVQIMERPALGGNPRTARALRDALWRAEASGSTVARSELMRQITRRLRAARSHIALDALTDPQLDGLLEAIVRESHHQLAGRALKLVPVDTIR